jgi:hypothetical protein
MKREPITRPRVISSQPPLRRDLESLRPWLAEQVSRGVSDVDLAHALRVDAHHRRHPELAAAGATPEFEG